MIDRYEIRRGRFGLYFYDLQEKRDVDLNEALLIMNDRLTDWLRFLHTLGDIER